MKSIDYAVMERTQLAAVVPADLGWSDVGSWDIGSGTSSSTTPPAMPPKGQRRVMDCHNSLVRSDELALTTVVGLDDVIVVSTADAVLVTSRSKAEQVKALVEQLKLHNHRAAARTSPYVPSLGLLPGHRYCRPLSCQAHCREARESGSRCKSTSTGRSTGWS